MKNKRNLILTIVEAIFLVLLVFGLLMFVKTQINPTPVFVWTQEIEAGQDILPNHIKEITIPGSAVNNTFLKDKKEIIGMKTSSRVYPGAYVYKSQAVKLEDLNPIDILDKETYRMFSLPVNLTSSVGGSVKQGDKIDLVFTGRGIKEHDNGLQTEYAYSKVFLQDVLVTSVNAQDGYKYFNKDEMLAGDPKGNQENMMLAANSQNIASITVALTLPEIEELTARIDTPNANIRLARRFKEGVSSETIGYVVGDYEKLFTGPANAETSITIVNEE